MERAVGWFVVIALLLLAAGFIYYFYTAAETKGWFVVKAPYFTLTESATGLKEGDPVQLMGFEVGRITKITAQPPRTPYNVYIEFEIKDPYYGYLWSEGSRAKINAADLLGHRVLEVTKGTAGYSAYLFFPLRMVSIEEAQAMPDLEKWRLAQKVFDQPSGTNLLSGPWRPLTNLQAIAAAGYKDLMLMNLEQRERSITGIWNEKQGRYAPYTKTNKPFWLMADESAAVTERLEKLLGQVEQALPNILNLTNQIALVLSNGTDLTSNLNLVAISAKPAVSNLAAATSNLDHPGALGEWLLPTNINQSLGDTLTHADSALATTQTNLAVLIDNMNRSLDNLADITSNLNKQVAANTNIVKSMSDAIVHTDELVQGLKHHWLFRSAFKAKKTNAPAATPPKKK
jgi:hypothetical protein